jgi:hypothetical protein
VVTRSSRRRRGIKPVERLEFIQHWVKSVKRPRLVIIDTFKRVRALKSQTTTQYDDDYEAVAESASRHPARDAIAGSEARLAR